MDEEMDSICVKCGRELSDLSKDIIWVSEDKRRFFCGECMNKEVYGE